MNQISKNKVSYLHFILAILVILIHAINNETKFEMIFSIEKGIGQFAVPLFFILSGFLFFRNIDIINEVKKKIQNRVYTVLIPYAIWNIIYYVLHYLMKPGVFDISDFYNAVVMYKYNPPFWFMWQLILLICITPILFYVIRDYKYYIGFLLFISMLVILNIDIPFINEDAIIYFSFGAFYARLYRLMKVKFIDKKYFLIFGAFFVFFFFSKNVALAFVNVVFKTTNLFTLMTIFFRLCGAMMFMYLLDSISKYDIVPNFMNNTFFLYAIHYMITRVLVKIVKIVSIKFLSYEVGTAVEIIVFVLTPIICVMASNVLSKIMKNKIPQVYNVLIGNR